MKIRFSWEIQDGKLSFDTGRLVIYNGYSFHANNPSMDHNDCIGALASKIKMDRASLLGKAYRFYWRRLGQDELLVSPVRKIDEDWVYGHKDEFNEAIDREFGRKINKKVN
ncbi:hypothetical protein [Treponema sp. R80B11-R83G3]